MLFRTGDAPALHASRTLGFVNVFKPSGPTSTQVGAQVKRFFLRAGEPKPAVGHVGTLDPTAAGVLPMALGNATRLIPLLGDHRKAYAFTLVLGVRTDTGDAAGKRVSSAPIPTDACDRLAALLPRFQGRIQQVPPMVSALRRHGKRLYDLARAGVVLKRSPRSVTIYDIRILGWEGNGRARLRVVCGGDVRAYPLRRSCRRFGNGRTPGGAPARGGGALPAFRKRDARRACQGSVCGAVAAGTGGAASDGRPRHACGRGFSDRPDGPAAGGCSGDSCLRSRSLADARRRR